MTHNLRQPSPSVPADRAAGTPTVMHRIAAAVFTLLTALALFTGIVGQAQAAPTTPPAASTSLAVPTVENVSYSASGPHKAANPWGITAKKTAAFATCIFGVGVPIGLAWGIATNPQVWAYVLGKGPLPASVGGTASKYLGTIKRACAYALR